ncbi:MAG: class I SAM-dependent methyltransferase [Oscillospiraceae bacterium]|jgi:ubiquinone/menaquinone biosynthesis C-methylase UbiE|nr:class I SAM-dependent methyltransferase [Oscillospiraceae bacterium]
MSQTLIDYYNAYDEDGRLELRHGSVEFLTTMRYIEKYLQSGARVLEIGAGTGRYSHALARQGFSVDAVELVPKHIEIFKSKITPDEKITIREGNALDLSDFHDNTYDITLLLGPMYHLYSTEDKLKALSEAIRVTKKGGVVFVAYCSTDASILDYGFKRGEAFNLVEKHMLDTETFVAHSEPEDIFELVRREDIDVLMANFEVERLHFVGTDMFTKYITAEIFAMDDATFELYLKYHFFICERADMVGISHHTLDIFRK